MRFRIGGLVAVVVVAGAAACGGNPAPAQGPQPVGALQQAPDRLVAREATVDVSVEELQPASARVDSLVAATDGIVESSRAVDEHRMDLQLRIPAPALDTVLAGLRSVGKIERELIATSDVTVEVSDLEARLTNLIAVRDRLISYLDEAEGIEEVISVERELTRVQTEIDTIRGRLALLRNQVAMSTIDLTLSRKRRLGPLGAVATGAVWAIKKLFILDE